MVAVKSVDFLVAVVDVFTLDKHAKSFGLPVSCGESSNALKGWSVRFAPRHATGDNG